MSALIACVVLSGCGGDREEGTSGSPSGQSSADGGASGAAGEAERISLLHPAFFSRAKVRSPLVDAREARGGYFEESLADLAADPLGTGSATYALRWPVDQRPGALRPELSDESTAETVLWKADRDLVKLRGVWDRPAPPSDSDASESAGSDESDGVGAAPNGEEDAAEGDAESSDASEVRSFHLLPAEVMLEFYDHPRFARGFPKPRRADGTPGVKVVRDFRAEFRLQRCGGPAQVELEARFLSGFSAEHVPTLRFLLDGEVVGEMNYERRSQDLSFELPAASGEQVLELIVEGTPKDPSTHKLVIEKLWLREKDGRDRLWVETPAPSALSGRLLYALAPPPIVESVKRNTQRTGPKVERLVRVMKGPAAIRSSRQQAIEVYLDGEWVARGDNAMEQEVGFTVPENRLATVEIRSRDGSPLAGDFWLIQPRAALAEELIVGRGQEEATGPEVVQHVEFGLDTRRSLLLFPDTEITIPVPAGPASTLSFAYGGASLEKVPFSSSSPQFEIEWVPEGGDPQQLCLDVAGRSAKWKEKALEVPARSVPGSIVFRCRSHAAYPRSVESNLIAIADPRLHAGVAPKPQNVLVYLVDTLRADHLGCYGYERDTSPNLDALAADGALFERCYAQAPWTRPSVATLFVGLIYSFHGATKISGLVPELETMAEHFLASGYQTAGFISNAQIHSKGLNFEQGFTQFVAIEDELGASRAHSVHERVLPWLEQYRDAPFFLYVHTLDPHAKYDPPEETLGAFGSNQYEGRLTPKLTGSKNLADASPLTDEEFEYVRALYDEEILYSDLEFGRLIARMKELDLYENTTIIVLSDHGEEFYEHGDWGHGGRLWQSLLHVPLIVKPAGEDRLRGLRVDDDVRLIDLYPTLSDLCDLGETGHPLHGVSLLPLLREDEFEHPLDVIAQEEPYLRSFARGGFKVIEEDWPYPARHTTADVRPREATPTSRAISPTRPAASRRDELLHPPHGLPQVTWEGVMKPVSGATVELSAASREALQRMRLSRRRVAVSPRA